MMISTRGRYALRVMLDLAKDESGTYVPLDDIARREGMSEKYLESIIVAAADGEEPGPRDLSRAGHGLPPGPELPHLPPVAGPGQGHRRLSDGPFSGGSFTQSA